MDMQQENLCKVVKLLNETLFGMVNALDQLCLNTAYINEQLERIVDEKENKHEM